MLRLYLRVEVGTAEERPTVLLEAASLGRLEVGVISLTGNAEVDSKGRSDLSVELDLRQAALLIVPDEADGFVRSLLPSAGGVARFDLAVGLSLARGLYFRGSGAFQVSIPVHMELGPVVIDAIGHWTPVEAAVEVNRRLADFLTEA